jgi:hypothetical protein
VRMRKQHKSGTEGRSNLAAEDDDETREGARSEERASACR